MFNNFKNPFGSGSRNTGFMKPPTDTSGPMYQSIDAPQQTMQAPQQTMQAPPASAPQGKGPFAMMGSGLFDQLIKRQMNTGVVPPSKEASPAWNALPWGKMHGMGLGVGLGRQQQPPVGQQQPRTSAWLSELMSKFGQRRF